MTEPTFRCRVYGYPVAWMRPRAQRVGGFIRFFTHKDVEDWKRTVVAQVLDKKPERPLQGALAVTMIFYLARPKSLPKKVRFHSRKPDAENCAKAVLDFLSGLVYMDDAQVADLRVRKEYGEQPGVDIEVRLMEAAEASPSLSAPMQERLI